jgi:cell division protein ZapA (FtsZ GTPase activity inhibitor)
MQPSEEKKAVRVNIFNQAYSLVTSGDPAQVEEAARQVDQLMHNYAKALNVDIARAAVLACMDLASQVQSLQVEMSHLKERVDAKTRELNGLLDRVMD